MRVALLAISVFALLSAQASAQSLVSKSPSPSEDGDRLLLRVSPEAATDPLKLIYRIPGVRANSPNDNQGSQTSIICTNYSNVPEKVRLIFAESGGTPFVFETTMSARQTDVFSTQATIAFGELILSAGILIRAMALVSSSTTNIHCTAMVHNATTETPQGVDLHMVRFNAFPGSQE